MACGNPMNKKALEHLAKANSNQISIQEKDIEQKVNLSQDYEPEKRISLKEYLRKVYLAAKDLLSKY